LKQQHLVDSAHIEQIIKQVICDVQSCNNKGNWCWVQDGVHLKIFANQLKIWSIGINEGKCTLDKPTDDFIKSLIPVKGTQMNPLHPTIKKPEKITPPSPNPQTPVQPAYPPYFMPSYPYFTPYSLPTPQPFTLPSSAHVSAPLTPPSNAHVELRSSSLPSDIDNVKWMVEYLHWLAKRTPTQSALFIEAKEALISAGYTFDVLGLLSDEKYEKLGIVDGIAFQIKTKGARFKRAQDNGRA
jgi:hypothetical protein